MTNKFLYILVGVFLLPPPQSIWRHASFVALHVGFLLYQPALLAASAINDANANVLFQGSPLVGGVNGIFFDQDNFLRVAQVYGRAISTLDPTTGNIVDQLRFDEPSGDLVAFPDDLFIDSTGTVYYTDPAYYQTVFARPPVGPSMPLVPIGSVPFANPVTMSDDETKLYYAQCWNVQEPNALFELDLTSFENKVILDGIFGCASNAMAYKDGSLYTPRPFEGRVVQVDVKSDPPIVRNITTNMVSPNAVKFDSIGNLYATDTATGEVVRILFDVPDKSKNREVLAKLATNSIDNLAFDEHDRLYVSNTADASITEILLGGTVRLVSPSGMSIPMGLALIEETQMLYTLHPGALYQIDPKTQTMSILTRSAVTLGPMAEPTSLVAWDDKLILLSATAGSMMIWNLDTMAAEQTLFFGGPIDAHPFRGDLLVTEIMTGRIVRAHGSDSFQSRDIIFEVPGAAPLFLAGNDDKVYVSDGARGLVFQIYAGGEILEPPRKIATVSSPEGIVLHPNGRDLLVVDSGTRSLLSIDLMSGIKRTVATNLDFLPGIQELPFGFPNDVVVLSDGMIAVNGDGTNVIYGILDPLNETSATSNTTGSRPSKSDVEALSSASACSLNARLISIFFLPHLFYLLYM